VKPRRHPSGGVAAGGSRRLMMAANPSQPRMRRFIMQKDEVKIGSTYLAKVSNWIVPVQILGESHSGGWIGINKRTNRKIHIKRAQRLLYLVG